MADFDAIVIGAGPNGLFAACRLARAGLRVGVFEANDRPGGALWTEATTGPGTLHDVGAGFVAFRDSPAFEALDLARHGLSFVLGTVESAHPGPDDRCPAIARDLDLSAATFGEDADAWRRLCERHRAIDPHLLAFLGPIGTFVPALRMGPVRGLQLAMAFAQSSGGLSRRWFKTVAAQRVLPSMGLHVDVGPDDWFGVPVCWMLTFRATTAGFGIPVGGAKAITVALLAELAAHGGTVQTGMRVDKITVEAGQACGVVLKDGTRVDAPYVLADTSAPALYLDLLPETAVPERVRQRMRAFTPGWGTFKLDLALSAPVPWRSETARIASVVHLGDSLDDLVAFTEQVRAGQLPDHPYLVVGQASLFDRLRAPGGGHALYVYTHAPAELDPSRYPGGWEAWRQRFADRIVARIEELAPGFASTVVARAVHDPSDLFRMSANLMGGDLGGGPNGWRNQLVFRPLFPYFGPRTPVRGVTLASSFTHPGAGIHGMCGWNAAGEVLRQA